MTSRTAPLSRPVAVARLPATGLDVTVEASEAERTALAAELGLPAIHALAGTFHLSGDPDLVRVRGRIGARIEQVCVVTLDPFESVLDEDISLEFESPERASLRTAPLAELDPDRDVPDEIVGGRIDLGAVTAEFLALGLDLHPRKPGVSFEPDESPSDDDSPFAVLKNRDASP